MTEQEKQEIKQEVLNAIKSESQGVTELEEVSSLDGVKTLPALRGTELVSAPVSLLGKPATDAAAQALAAKAAAEGAAGNANTAAGNADAKAQAAQTAAQEATDAKEATSKPRKQPKQWWNSMRAWQCWRGTAPPPALPAYWMT